MYIIIHYKQVKQSLLLVNNKSWKFIGKTFLNSLTVELIKGKKPTYMYILVTSFLQLLTYTSIQYIQEIAKHSYSKHRKKILEYRYFSLGLRVRRQYFHYNRTF